MQTQIFRLVLALAILPAVASLTSCHKPAWGDGETVTEERTVTDFHALEVNMQGKVEVRVGPEFKLEVTCEEDIIDYLETEVKDGKLKIDFDRTVFDADDLRIVVTAPSWDFFDVTGSADVTVLDSLPADQRLDLTVTGSGNLKLKYADFKVIKADVTGSGNLELAGFTDDLNVEVNGSGDFDGFDCSSKKTNAEVSGSGNVQTSTSETLDATVSGSGDILYKGEPTVTQNVSGSGKVKKVN